MRFFLALLLLCSARAFAFPEMVRHGYVNCNSCHISMVGGNLLNAYGRSQSRELLSQKTLFGKESPEGEEQFAYGLVKTPEWLNVQLDTRLLQFFSESKEASRGRFLIMQVDADGAAQWNDHWKVFGSVGRIESKKTDATAKDFFYSPRHGIEYSFFKADSTQRLALRAGRFMPAYGINFAEHTFVTRDLLDFSQAKAQERYAAELAWNNDWASIIATGIFSQNYMETTRKEKGGAIQASMGIREKSKIGVNYYQTAREMNGVKFDRRIYGMFAHIGFSEKWYGLLEVDRPQRPDQKWGLVELFKLGYEVHQGLHLIGVQEFANLNLDQSGHKFGAYSVGTEWFPRPHFDLYALYRRQRGDLSNSAADDLKVANNSWQDQVWLIGHFYF